MNSGKSQQDKQKEFQTGNQTNSNMTLPIESKGSNKHDNDAKTFGAPGPPSGEKNGTTVDGENGKANVTMPKLGNNDSCKGSMITCRDQEMLACIEASKDGGTYILSQFGASHSFDYMQDSIFNLVLKCYMCNIGYCQ